MTARKNVLLVVILILTIKDISCFDLTSWLPLNVTHILPNFFQKDNHQLSLDNNDNNINNNRASSSESPTPKQIETSTFQMSPSSPSFYYQNEISKTKDGFYELTWSPVKPIEMSEFESLRNKRRKKTTESPTRTLETLLVETTNGDISKTEPTPLRQADSITYTPLAFLGGALAIIAAIVVFIYISYRVDVYATERLDEFLLDYYGPHIYDRYTTRFDSYPMERPLQQPPFGLKATTAKDYYGLKRGFESFTLEDVGAKILSFISEADKLYDKPKN